MSRKIPSLNKYKVTFGYKLKKLLPMLKNLTWIFFGEIIWDNSTKKISSSIWDPILLPLVLKEFIDSSWLNPSLSKTASITLFSKITTIKSPTLPVTGEKPKPLEEDQSITTLMLKPLVKDIYINLSTLDQLIVVTFSMTELPLKEDLSKKLFQKLKLTVTTTVKTNSTDLWTMELPLNKLTPKMNH